MDNQTFQEMAHTFADYTRPVVQDNEEIRVCDYVYPALGLAEESGELVGKFAKAIRDCNGKVDEERRNAILYELGDVLWFCAEIATILEADLSEVMQANIDKLTSRKLRGKIHGSGDNR